jgi:uncharacterized protein (TIGR02466 family)
MEKNLFEVVPFNSVFYYSFVEDQSHLIPHIKKLQQKNTGEIVSNQGGWQSSQYSYESLDEFKNLCNEVFEYCNHVFSIHGFPKERSYKLSYWINVNKKYNYNKSHDHANSLLSCVVYVKVPKNSGQFVIERPDLMEVYWKKVLENNLNDKTYLQWKIDPEPNKLLIFPSWLKHHVEQNLTNDEDDERISISFNVS